jgi:hypothetical protein
VKLCSASLVGVRIQILYSAVAYTQTSGLSSGDWSLGTESYSNSIIFDDSLLTFNPSDYTLEDEGNNLPIFENPAPPLQLGAIIGNSPAAGPTYRRKNDCTGCVPDGNWCAQNCACFTVDSVC